MDVFLLRWRTRTRVPVAVIGPDAAEAMFAEADPIGKQILIQGHLFTILGVAEKSKLGSLISSADNFVLIPYGTSQDHALGRYAPAVYPGPPRVASEGFG